ncbi:caspase family protein [Crocosphaera sp.]|uniref:caspase family protein n=1 Tax=Crocosphaera sp. TaxID=2729996 RepID=UPI00262A6D24|nr:caspase family protein [Crocosphaera sp.]MDJ0580594.1 caspase family protein [Crocosphaera sp.]
MTNNPPKKVALLIGISQYQGDLPSLPAVTNDIENMKQVLEDKNLGWFDQVKALLNPDLETIQIEIGKLFSNCQRQDLALLFFAGHGLLDDNDSLYLATSSSNRKDFEFNSIRASFIHDILNKSRCKRKIIIFDCCYSGAFAQNWQSRGHDTLNLQKQFGGEGQAVLTSSSSAQKSFEKEGSGIYTRYLIEGLNGAADRNNDGKITIQELHDYAKEKVEEATQSKMKPEIYLFKDGSKIILSRAAQNILEVEYRQLVEESVDNGQLSDIALENLKFKQQELKLTDEQAEEIKSQVCEFYTENLENLQRYREALQQQTLPLTQKTCGILKYYKSHVLSLSEKEAKVIEKEILPNKEFRKLQGGGFLKYLVIRVKNILNFPKTHFYLRRLIAFLDFIASMVIIGCCIFYLLRRWDYIDGLEIITILLGIISSLILIYSASFIWKNTSLDNLRNLIASRYIIRRRIIAILHILIGISGFIVGIILSIPYIDRTLGVILFWLAELGLLWIYVGISLWKY